MLQIILKEAQAEYKVKLEGERKERVRLFDTLMGYPTCWNGEDPVSFECEGVTFQVDRSYLGNVEVSREGYSRMLVLSEGIFDREDIREQIKSFVIAVGAQKVL